MLGPGFQLSVGASSCTLKGLRSDAGQDWASAFNDLLGEVTDSDNDAVADGAPVAEAPLVGSSISAPL
eukprot:8898913-Pyramimonas_sp.AAC.1